MSEMYFMNKLTITRDEESNCVVFKTSDDQHDLVVDMIKKNPGASFVHESFESYDGYGEDSVAILKGKNGVVEFSDDYIFKYWLRQRWLGLPSELMKCKDFFIARAERFNKIKNSRCGIYYANNDFSQADAELRGNTEFVIELMKICHGAFRYALPSVQSNPVVLNEYVKRATDRSDFESFLKENRITVAYELCKINPLYEVTFGEPLKKKLNGMNIIDYVEKQNLRKSLKKSLPKNATKVTRHKI